MAVVSKTDTPPPILELLAHDIRWKLITALARSDLRVHELVSLVQQPANLVSYHLKKLRARQLVIEHRSAADGRDIYYSLNLERLRLDFLASGRAIHPTVVKAEIAPEAQGSNLTPARVLFLCTHNSARSQMAEAILRHLGGDRVEAFSAGSDPQPIHPYARQAMAEMKIDISQQYPKHLDMFVGQSFDYIITVCDRVREICPIFPNDPERIHWSIPDPAEGEGSKAAQYRMFKDVALQLTTRINHLLIFIDRNQANR